jgi:hypothetical protein
MQHSCIHVCGSRIRPADNTRSSIKSCWVFTQKNVHSSTMQYTSSLEHGYGRIPPVNPGSRCLLASCVALTMSISPALPGSILRWVNARHPKSVASHNSQLESVLHFELCSASDVPIQNKAKPPIRTISSWVWVRRCPSLLWCIVTLRPSRLGIVRPKERSLTKT